MTRTGITRMFFAVIAFLNLAVRAAVSALRALPATVPGLLDLRVRPVVIAHRGFGDNVGEDAERPLENTIAAVRAGYTSGAAVVEVDVQLTADGELAVYHDDVLPDRRCVNALTLAELQRRLPHVPSLRAVLRQARALGGLLIVELKAPAPLCDPDDVQERAIVSAVVRTIRRMRMTRQVMLASFSPSLLFLAREQAPEIARALAVSALQFLTATDLEARFGLRVRRIDKRVDVGLRWAEVGAAFRLPGYADVEQFLDTAVATAAGVVEIDLELIGAMGTSLVESVQARGFKTFGFTATTPEEWFVLGALGLDGIYMNDVPFGVRYQAAPVPAETGPLLAAR